MSHILYSVKLTLAIYILVMLCLVRIITLIKPINIPNTAIIINFVPADFIFLTLTKVHKNIGDKRITLFNLK